MDDRSLREYAFNIFKGIRGYTLTKAFSLFPKYYPKIAFYYAEMLTKQQSEFSLRMIQSLGIDKGRALLNEYNILNNKITKFYVNISFRINECYRKIEAATDKDRNSVIIEQLDSANLIAKQSCDFIRKSDELLSKVLYEAKKYNFYTLENDIRKVVDMNYQANMELYKLNKEFSKYLKGI